MTKLCECECGREAPIATHTNPRYGAVKGMPQRFVRGHNASTLRHGSARREHVASEYVAFAAAKGRCTNPKNEVYEHYRGRGIEFLFTSFEEFFAELGPKPGPEYSLDRIDNNGPYVGKCAAYPNGNCRWGNSESAEPEPTSAQKEGSMIGLKVSEVCDQIVSVRLGDFPHAYDEIADPPAEIVESMMQERSVRHQALLNSLMTLFCEALEKSGAAYEIVALIVSDALAPDLQPETVSNPNNANHPCGLVRAIYSQTGFFPGNQLEQKLSAAHFLFRALGQANTPNYDAEQILLNTGVEVLKDVVLLEEAA